MENPKKPDPESDAEQQARKLLAGSKKFVDIYNVGVKDGKSAGCRTCWEAGFFLGRKAGWDAAAGSIHNPNMN